MSVILVPYHRDDLRPTESVPLPEGVETLRLTPELPEGDIWTRLAAIYRELAEAVATVVRGGGVPVVVSGDCTVSLGVLAGVQRGGVDAGVVWFDAHGDVQTLETSASGYIGGLPLRMIAGYRPELLAGPVGLRAVDEDRLTLVDGRDLDPPEAEYLATAAIRRSTVPGLTVGPLPDGPFVLHVDLDVIDAAEIPGLIFPVPGGPSSDEVFAAMDRVLATGRVAAVDIACTWHPPVDAEETRVRAALLERLVGVLRAG